MECIEGTGQMNKREEIHFSLYSKTNRGNSPNKTVLSQEHINTPKQNILIQLSFFLLSRRQMDKKSNTPPTSDTVFLFFGQNRRSINGLVAFVKSAKVVIFRQ